MKTLYTNAVVLTPDGKYIKNGCVAQDDGIITYVGDETGAPDGYIRYDCRGGLLSPAFYNIHCHAAMTLFRGVGEDLPLDRWLNEKIYPAEDRLTPESVRIGSLLAAAEMIRGGVVSFSDMYFMCDETARVVLDTGMKANISRCLVSFDEDADVKNDDRFNEAVALVNEYHNAGDGRLKIDMSVHAEYTNKAKYCRGVADYAHANSLGLQVHVSETKLETEECKARNHGMTPTEFLAETGILVPTEHSTTTAAHCVWLTEHDIELLRELRVNVAHNPVSNLKLASGVAPLKKLLDANINVGLGTDGAASNNKLSILRELQLAALLHKGVNLSADIIPTNTICTLAQRSGALAQGRYDCGELKAGSRADFILIDLDAINNIPMYDPYYALAFSVNPDDIRLTVCDGRVLYENGEYKTLDIEKLKAEARPILEHYFD